MGTYSKSGAVAVAVVGAAMLVGACSSGRDTSRQDMSSMQRPSSVNESAPARSNTPSAPPASRPAQTAQADTTVRPPSASTSSSTTMNRPETSQSSSVGATGTAGTMETPRPRQSRG